MALELLFTFVSIGLIAFAYGAIKKWRRSSNHYPLPPGPPPLPLLGNALDMPKDYWWLKFAEWSKQYGDIVHLNVLGQHIIILDSIEATKELLDRRSAIYSDRPHMPMVMDLMGWNWSFTLMRYGDEWKHHRKVFHQCFNADNIVKYHDMQTLEARRTVARLIESPLQFMDHIRLYFAAIIMRVVYGIEVQDTENVYYQVAKFQLQEVAEAVAPGRYLVDFLPILKHVPSWMPGAGFQRKAKICRELMSEFRDRPYHHVKEEILRDIAVQSIVSEYLREMPEENSKTGEAVLMDVAAVAFSAGADTTVSTLQTFFLAMTLFPDVQRKAQACIDEVVRYDRLPTFDDLQSLPYIHAIFKELLRWQPVLPIGGPHRVMRDDEYKGYLIPKDTLVLGNSWSLLHDEKTYPDPMAFRPERFLNDDGTLNEDMQDPDVAAFGYGRRKCPGRYFAANGALITIATILATLDISSDEVEPSRSDFTSKCLMTADAMSYPKPFTCRILPRNSTSAEVAKQSLSD